MMLETQHFLEDVWPDCLQVLTMTPERVYNMDETGLFWRALPSQTLAKVDERVQGSKTQKDRLTFATICMDGIVLQWMHNRKAWMTNEFFCELILDLNHFFRQKHKKIILPVDNYPANKVDSVTDWLDFVKFVSFLPMQPP